MENKNSGLIWSHSLHLPSYGSLSQDDPKNPSVQLSHHPDSPRKALVLGPFAALNRNPTLITNANNTSLAVSQSSGSQQSIKPSNLMPGF